MARLQSPWRIAKLIHDIPGQVCEDMPSQIACWPENDEIRNAGGMKQEEANERAPHAGQGNFVFPPRSPPASGRRISGG